VLSVGSLFAGIGGFDLGFERAGGFRTAWFCEQDEFCQHVLAQHWPGVPCYPDITQLRAADIEPVDVLCGGFPCQDLSVAGKGAGLAGARSGLWSEYARLIGELGPRYVVVENVSALLARGLGVVLGDLAALGYDAEWDCIPASALGAPHRRDRVWLVAYPGGARRRKVARGAYGDEAPHARGRPTDGGADVADTDAQRRREGLRLASGGVERPGQGHAVGSGEYLGEGWGRASDASWWAAEPDVGRVAHGIPARMDRLRSLGNALVPQIAEWIGARILDYEQGAERAAA
jgi:DNA (cytosine-5)-methyltransferase 1